MNANNQLSSLSKADTDEKMAQFWDTHDFTDFDTDVLDIQFEIAFSVPIEVELFKAIEIQANKRGISVETLVNLWLQQKLTEQKVVS